MWALLPAANTVLLCGPPAECHAQSKAIGNFISERVCSRQSEQAQTFQVMVWSLRQISTVHFRGYSFHVSFTSAISAILGKRTNGADLNDGITIAAEEEIRAGIRLMMLPKTFKRATILALMLRDPLFKRSHGKRDEKKDMRLPDYRFIRGWRSPTANEAGPIQWRDIWGVVLIRGKYSKGAQYRNKAIPKLFQI